MTNLETAFAEAAKLPLAEQNELAAFILEEIKSEKQWKKAFDTSADVLAQLADEALEEHRTGKTKPLNLS